MKKPIAVCALVVVFVFLIITAVKIHPFGDVGESKMDDYFIANAQNETGTNNVCTSIVFDYRGYDTLGEATVLFTAVTGIALLFRRKKQ